MSKKLNWRASKRRKIRLLSVKEESEHMKSDTAAKWIRKAERLAAQRIR